MKIRLLGVLALALSACSLPRPRFDASIYPDARPDILHWNLDGTGLALQGFDPVSYFPQGGGEPRLGDPGRIARYLGVTYRFASEANRKHFQADPEAFEPAYGGWCAWAMIDGDKVDIDPESFVIQDGELLLFYDGIFGDTRARWLKQPRTSKPRADRAWQAIVAPPEPAVEPVAAGS